MTARERFLLAAAIAGFVVPNALIAAFVARHGFDAGAYLGDWVEALPATQLAADVIIAFVAFAAWAAWEGRDLGMRTWWLPIPAALLVGVCFAIPLFLLLRERATRATGPTRAKPRAADPAPSGG